MHGTKVNTKISSGAKNVLLPTEFIGRIETPFGALYINQGDAQDHAHMRASQLTGLLQLMRTEAAGAERFCMLGDAAQDSLLWLAGQLAEEMGAMVSIIADDTRPGCGGAQ